MITREVLGKQYERKHKDVEWARDIERYARAKRCAEVLEEHVMDSSYWKNVMVEIESKYPGKLE